MKVISHRINTISDLEQLPGIYGAEVDIRSAGSRLYIHHDPYVPGVDFEEWLDRYQHGTLILNVKEDGLEEKLISLMESYSVRDFFFLDQSIPTTVRLAKDNETRLAIRYSEFESIDTVKSFSGLADWVWVDCFNHFFLDIESAQELKMLGFKLCLVSPELQGRNDTLELEKIKETISAWPIKIDAVCTKKVKFWYSLT